VDAFREGIEELHPHLAASLVKKAKVQSAEEIIFLELDLLNLKYQQLVAHLYDRLHQLEVIAKQEDPSFEVRIYL
jgi:hypothetical protein